jgi:PAS domain S-box-containing protein
MNIIPAPIMQMSPDIIWTLDKDGFFLQLSAATKNILGYRPEELTGKSYKDILYISDQQCTAIAETELLKTKRLSSFRNHFVTKYGKPVMLEWDVTYDDIENVRYCIGKHVDKLTGLPKDEESLIKSEGFFKTIFKDNPSPMFVYDPETLKFLLVNKAALEQYGYTREEFNHITVADLQNDEVKDSFKSKLNVYLKHPQTRIADVHKIKNGNRIDVMAYGQNIWLEGKYLRFVTCINISDTKTSKEQLQLFESIITNVDDGIVITGPADDGVPKIVYTNHAFQKITGYKSSELLGQHVSVLHGPDTDKNQLKKLRRSLQLGEPFFGEILNYNKNGAPFWMSLNIAPVKNSMGLVKNYIGISRDITESRRMETEKELLVRDLMQSDTDLKQFSFITSHNFRAPLSNILAIIQLIETSNMDKESKRLVRLLKSSSYQLSDTIDDLVNILILKERGDVEEKSLVDIKSLFETALSRHKNSVLAANGEIKATFIEKWVRFNSATLISVFDQLISNAIKFRKINEQLQINVHSFKSEGKIIIAFEDNGIGVNYEAVKERLFGLYQRFHPDTEGKGLGLFLLKAQLQSMNANVKVESAINQGFKLTIEIPE